VDGRIKKKEKNRTSGVGEAAKMKNGEK